MKNLTNNHEKLILIISNLPNNKIILKLIIKKILKKKFSCCINYTKINSIFIWKKKIVKKKEYKITFKTIFSLKNKVIKIIKKYHPYKIPEILIKKINYINTIYYKWFKKHLYK